MRFEPHEDIELIPEDFRKKWAAALRNSKQAREVMCTKDGAMCCLGVAEVLDGKDADWIRNQCLEERAEDQSAFADVGLRFDGKLLQSLHLAWGDGEQINPTTLNDEYLTHPEIADLLDGKIVEISSQ